MVNTMPLRVDMHPHPPYKDCIYWFTKTCAICAVLTDNLMLTNYFTNNLYGLPYRPHTPDIDVAYSWCLFALSSAIYEPGLRYGSVHSLDNAAAIECV